MSDLEGSESEDVDYENIARNVLIDDGTLRLHGLEWEQKKQ